MFRRARCCVQLRGQYHPDAGGADAPSGFHDIAVTLNADSRALRSHWFCARTAPCWSPAGGYPVSMKLATVRRKNADGGYRHRQRRRKLTFNIDGLARVIAPLRDACTGRENKNMAMDLRNPDVWLATCWKTCRKISCPPRLMMAMRLGVCRQRNRQARFTGAQPADIPELQRRGLMLLASETKDFACWPTCCVPCNMPVIFCWPQDAGTIYRTLLDMRRTAEHGHKKRFAAQVIKRFESAVQDLPGMLRQYSAMLCWESWQNWPVLAGAQRS